MTTTPDGAGQKSRSGDKDSPSWSRWLKKPAVWIGTLITAVITGVLINLATGTASNLSAHGGAASKIEVDSVTAQYLPRSPQGGPQARPVKIEFEIRNTGDQLAIIRAARLTVQQFAALPHCLAQGGLPITGIYKAFLPMNPSPGASVDIPTAQQVGPDAADRFGIKLGLPVGASFENVYVYRVRIGLLINNSSVPANAGEAIIALPSQPDQSYFWSKQTAAHPDYMPAFQGSAVPQLGQCLIKNSRKLGAILTMAGARPAQLAEIPSQLSFCCGWKLPIVKAQQVCGPALTRPAGMSLSCDSTGALENMKWSTWTFSHATGTGTYRLRSCTPSCANGKDRRYSVTVRFDKPVYTAKNGWLWDRVTFDFAAASPYSRSTVVQNNLVPAQ